MIPVEFWDSWCLKRISSRKILLEIRQVGSKKVCRRQSKDRAIRESQLWLLCNCISLIYRVNIFKQCDFCCVFVPIPRLFVFGEWQNSQHGRDRHFTLRTCTCTQFLRANARRCAVVPITSLPIHKDLILLIMSPSCCGVTTMSM